MVGQKAGSMIRITKNMVSGRRQAQRNQSNDQGGDTAKLDNFADLEEQRKKVADPEWKVRDSSGPKDEYLFSEMAPEVKEAECKYDANASLRKQLDAKIALEKKKQSTPSTLIDTITRQLTDWNPYDQNASSPYFDPEWMFNVTEGFDIVIGNPPYIGVRTGLISPDKNQIYKKSFSTAKGQYDIFCCFIELANRLVNVNGVLSYIIPKRFLSNQSFELARLFLLNNLPISSYLDAGMPFDDAVEANVIIALRTSRNIVSCYKCTEEKIKWFQSFNHEFLKEIPFSIFPFNFDKETLKIVRKVSENKVTTLGILMNIERGMECGFNHPSIGKTKTQHPIIKGEHILKYVLLKTIYYVDLSKASKSIIKSHEIYRRHPKLLMRFCSNSLDVAYDKFGIYNTNSVYNISLKSECKNQNIRFYLGLLNSKLINTWFFNLYCNDDKLYPHIQKNQVENIPIPVITPRHASMISSDVDRILSAKEADPTADTSALEAEIDQIVYRLYGLTTEEIEIVEDLFKKK